MQVAASMSVGRLAPKHTLNLDGIRELSKNVSPKLIKDNVVLRDNLHGRTIEEYTNDTFQPIIDAYNKKQRRKDRKINVSYCEWHKNNGTLSQGKGQLAYEAVLQYGTHDDLGGEYYAADTTPERKEALRKEFTNVYRQWVDDLERDFPHMTIVYASIHFDETEGTPHLHVCFQPKAECTRGLSQQVSVGRALSQDGIERLETRAEAEHEGGFQLARFYKIFHHQYQNRTLQALGYEIKDEKHGVKHIEKDGYSVVMAQAQENAQKIVQEAENRKETVKKETDRIKAKTLSTVYEAQEAAIAAKQEKTRAEQQKAVIEAQAASVKAQAEEESKQMIANATETAQKALEAAKAAKAEQERAEKKKAAAEAQTDAIKQQAKAEAQVQVVELEKQLSQARKEIKEKDTLIQKFQKKLNQVKEYLQQFHMLDHFLNWDKQKERDKQKEQAQTQSEGEEERTQSD